MKGNENIYTTFETPVAGDGSRDEPFKSKSYNFDDAVLRRDYCILWYGKQLPKHPLKKRILSYLFKTPLPQNKIVVDITVKNCSKDMEERLLHYPDVKIIKTKDEWRF